MPDVLEGPAPSSNPAQGCTAWRRIFQQWPPGVPTKGLVVTSQGEQIPFEQFFCTDELVLLDRPTPDTVGARRVIVPYEGIAAVKITAVTQDNAFESLGFAPPAKPEKVKPERPRRPFMP